MLITTPRKNKIVLSDYPYRRDIENRLFMADLTAFEVHVLEEILHGSLKISVEDLADNLGCTLAKLYPILDNFSRTGLLMRKNDQIIVDKEMRKYYEFQILKFDENFRPNLEYLQALLSKVPISSLPNWYSIPRTADNIFESIIEKHFLTPKIYQKYLDELTFDDPILHKMVDEVFRSPDLKVFSKQLREKYSLSRERFEECILHLEFNFVCCLSYTKIDDVWREVITPFHEWREYQLFLRKSSPVPISTPSQVIRKHSHDFGFLEDLKALLDYLDNSKSLDLSKFESATATSDFLASLRENNRRENCDDDPSYLQDIVHAIVLLDLASKNSSTLVYSKKPTEYLSHSMYDQAMLLYRETLRELIKAYYKEYESIEKNVRDTEKSLKRVLNSGWILFNDFMKGFIAPIGNIEKVSLKRIGKKWRYVLPTYGEAEKLLIKRIILKRLFEVGVVALGTYDGEICFQVTPFGKMALGD